MCGRFLLVSPSEAIARRFAVETAGRNLRPRYNIAPGQEIHVVRCDDDGSDRRVLMPMRWGLEPAWMSRSPSRPLINARVETAHERPAFRAAWARRRCLVPADGWYEWQAPASGDGPRQPWLLRLRAKAARPFAFAGLWARQPHPECPGAVQDRVAILTMPTPPEFSDIHDRMPLIPVEEDWARWLDPRTPPPPWPSSQLRSVPAEAIETWPVSRRVNRVENDDPGLIAPLMGGTRMPSGDLFEGG